MSYLRLLYVRYRCVWKDDKNHTKYCMLPKRFYSWENYPMDEVEKEKPLKWDP